MKRMGLTWQVDPEHWAEYKDIHLNPWPELIEALQAEGIHNYSIFAFGTRVFAYLEVDDENALANLEKTELKHQWNEKVSPWVLPEAEAGSGVQFMELERIFFCE